MGSFVKHSSLPLLNKEPHESVDTIVKTFSPCWFNRPPHNGLRRFNSLWENMCTVRLYGEVNEKRGAIIVGIIAKA
ncbi:hypothetical protein TNCV_2016781 [Trichonephila clavipes]|nr:hypothetical protein TNCV_2016781 [Trichonephila clavipes]